MSTTVQPIGLTKRTTKLQTLRYVNSLKDYTSVILFQRFKVSSNLTNSYILYIHFNELNSICTMVYSQCTMVFFKWTMVQLKCTIGTFSWYFNVPWYISKISYDICHMKFSEIQLPLLYNKGN